MRAYPVCAAVVSLLCAASASIALDLNYAGEFTRIPSHGPGAAAPAMAAQRAVHVRLRSQLYGTALSGNAARSYRSEDWQYANVVSATYRHPFASAERQLQLTANLRNTQDRRLQQDAVELTGWMLDYGHGPAHRLQAGDIALHGQRHVCQRSLLGASYQGATAVAGGDGRGYAGYGRLEQAVEGVQYRRMLLASGVAWTRSLQQRLVRALSLEAGYANARDDAGSIDDHAGLVPLTNHVFGVGLGLAAGRGTRLRADLAISRLVDQDTDASSEDHAWSAELDQVFAAGALRLGWEEVQPDFRSLSGSGNPDTRRLHSQLSWRVGRRLNLGAGLVRYQSGHAAAELTTTTPSAQAVVQPCAARPGSSALQQLRLALRLSRPAYESGAGAVDRSTLHHLWSLSSVAGAWEMGLTYAGQSTRDEVNAANDRARDNIGLTLQHPRLLSLPNVQGSLSIALDRDADGLEAAADRNVRSRLAARSAGTLGPLQYACGASLDDADLAAGQDYQRVSWDASLSRQLGGPHELLVGAAIDGRHRRSAAAGTQGDLGEITARVQMQASF